MSSTIKIYLAAISACHVGLDHASVRHHPFICRFMKGVRWTLPVMKRPHLGPLEDIGLKLLSYKTALLLALVSVKCVDDLHAFLVHPSCKQTGKDSCSGQMRPLCQWAFQSLQQRSDKSCPQGSYIFTTGEAGHLISGRLLSLSKPGAIGCLVSGAPPHR